MEINNTISSLLSEIIRLQFTKSHGLFEEYGLHPGQAPLLLCLYEEDGLSQSTLASKLHVKPSTITVMIQRLERNGMLYKQIDTKDKRICRAFLTEKGYTTCKALKELYENTESLYKKNLNIEEQIILKRLLLQIRDNLVESKEDIENI